MILDTDLFQEVVTAVGIETCLAVIKMFQEQSPILVAGAKDAAIDPSERAESVHALKGMARQLGLVQLSAICHQTENALINRDDGDAIHTHLSDLETSLFHAQGVLAHEATRLSAT